MLLENTCQNCHASIACQLRFCTKKTFKILQCVSQNLSKSLYIQATLAENGSKFLSGNQNIVRNALSREVFVW